MDAIDITSSDTWPINSYSAVLPVESLMPLDHHCRDFLRDLIPSILHWRIWLHGFWALIKCQTNCSFHFLMIVALLPNALGEFQVLPDDTADKSE